MLTKEDKVWLLKLCGILFKGVGGIVVSQYTTMTAEDRAKWVNVMAERDVEDFKTAEGLYYRDLKKEED